MIIRHIRSNGRFVAPIPTDFVRALVAMACAATIGGALTSAAADCDEDCEKRFKAASESLGQRFVKDVLGEGHKIDVESFRAGIESASEDGSQNIEHTYPEIAAIFAAREVALRTPAFERLSVALIEHDLNPPPNTDALEPLGTNGLGEHGKLLRIKNADYLAKVKREIAESDDYVSDLVRPATDGMEQSGEEPTLAAAYESDSASHDASRDAPDPGQGRVLPEPTEVTVSYRRLTANIGEDDEISLATGEWQTRRFPSEGVIEGWRLGIQRMQERELIRLLVPPELAYGYRGAGDDIASGETLLYELMLLERHGN